MNSLRQTMMIITTLEIQESNERDVYILRCEDVKVYREQTSQVCSRQQIQDQANSMILRARLPE